MCSVDCVCDVLYDIKNSLYTIVAQMCLLIIMLKYVEDHCPNSSIGVLFLISFFITYASSKKEKTVEDVVNCHKSSEGNRLLEGTRNHSEININCGSIDESKSIPGIHYIYTTSINSVYLNTHTEIKTIHVCSTLLPICNVLVNAGLFCWCYVELVNDSCVTSELSKTNLFGILYFFMILCALNTIKYMYKQWLIFPSVFFHTAIEETQHELDNVGNA